MEVTNIKFHGNPSGGSSTDTCGQTDRHTDVTKLIGAFANMRTHLIRQDFRVNLYHSVSLSKSTTLNIYICLLI
jgi:hypothetical protein